MAYSPVKNDDLPLDRLSDLQPTQRVSYETHLMVLCIHGRSARAELKHNDLISPDGPVSEFIHGTLADAFNEFSFHDASGIHT